MEPEQVRAWAMEAGFDEAGWVALPYANQARDAARFTEWVSAGRAATMSYLTRSKTEPDGNGGELIRTRVAVPFPWARSAVVCFANYNSAQPLSTGPAAAGAGWIARYAWSSRVDADGARRPSDYHKVLLKRLKALEARLHEKSGEFEARAYVDTGPVVERALATAAGIGWTGKNTCLIHPKLGSYGFLAVLLTSLDVEDQPSATTLDPSQLTSKSRVPPVSILRPGIPQPFPHTETGITTPDTSRVPLVSILRPGIPQPFPAPETGNTTPDTSRVPLVSILRPGIQQPYTAPETGITTPDTSRVPLVSILRPGIPQPFPVPETGITTPDTSRAPLVSILRPGIPQPFPVPETGNTTPDTSEPLRAPSFRRLSGERVGSHNPQSAIDPENHSAALPDSIPVQNENPPKVLPDRCGTCRRCLDACPTDALFAPYQMDATRCISYLTIEHRGPIGAELMHGMGRQVFGCDICQDVCPWNRKSPIGTDPDLDPRAELVNPSLDWLASLDEPAFERLFNGSPIRRTGFLGLRRNLAIAMGNSGLARYVSTLVEWSEAADEGLRTAARWALEKLNGQ
jgi:epoxyqueuosine reductase QueG